jgi:antitoxin component of MazEF toxin-antitoxin module
VRVEIIHTGGIGDTTKELEVRLDNGAALGRFPITGDPTGDRIKLEDLLEAIREEAVEEFKEQVDWNEVGL